MWKWIVFAVVAYALYRLFANDLKRKFGLGGGAPSKGGNAAGSGAADTDMVKDPECGAYVAADSIITVRDGETVHRFCSYDCRDKFLRRLGHGGGLPKADAPEGGT